MKSLILAFISLFIINSLCYSQSTNYPNGVTGCIARWDFASNGIVTSLPDVSGNNNNGTSYNLTTANGFRNIPNAAMKFDGSSSYAQVPNSTQLCPQQMTMIALVKFNGFYSGTCQGNQIISKGWPAFIAGQYGLSVSDNVYDNDCGVYSPTKDELSVLFGSASYSSSQSASNFIDTTDWYFLVGTYDGNTVKYYEEIMDTNNYINNVAPIYSATNINSPIGTNTQDLSIGKHLDPTFPYWFNGSMDEAAIFNKALSDAEVQSVYDYLWGSHLDVSVINKPNVSLYPSPSKGNITITGSVSGNKADIEIVNGLGQVVYTRHSGINGQNINEKFALPDNIPSGFYLLRLTAGEQISVLPFMLNR